MLYALPSEERIFQQVQKFIRNLTGLGPGCIIDGAGGRVSERFLKMMGLLPIRIESEETCPDGYEVEEFNDEGDYYQAIEELVDEVTDLINEHLPEGWHVEWWEGDLSLLYDKEPSVDDPTDSITQAFHVHVLPYWLNAEARG